MLKIFPGVRTFKYVEMDDVYRIHERPYLQHFLDFLFTNYNVAVWTAVEKDYAKFIVENFILVKPDRRLDFVMFNNLSYFTTTYW